MQQDNKEEPKQLTFLLPGDRNNFHQTGYKGIMPSPNKTPDNFGSFVSLKQKYKELGNAFNLKDYFELTK